LLAQGGQLLRYDRHLIAQVADTAQPPGHSVTVDWILAEFTHAYQSQLHHVNLKQSVH
jgi:hypothetical protein